MSCVPLPCPGAMLPVRTLAALRAQLAARGVITNGMVATRLQATLDLSDGRTVAYRGGWLCWPALDSSRGGGVACAVHWAGDLAGAVDRLIAAKDADGCTDDVWGRRTASAARPLPA